MTAVPCTEWTQKLPEDGLSQRGGLADQFMCLLADLFCAAALAVGFQIFYVVWQRQPAVDQAFIQFQVALQAVGVGSIAERLVIATCGRSKV